MSEAMMQDVTVERLLGMLSDWRDLYLATYNDVDEPAYAQLTKIVKHNMCDGCRADLEWSEHKYCGECFRRDDNERHV